MNKINKKYTNSTFLIYNSQGQVVISKRFLPKGTKRYFEYKGIRARNNSSELKSKFSEAK